MINKLKKILFWCLLAPVLAKASTIDPSIASLPIKLQTGEVVTLQQYLGKKPVYLKFWASWCSECQHEMPGLQKIYEQYGKKVEVLAINLGINDDRKSVQVIRKKFGLTFPIAIDETGKLGKAFDLIGTPYHVLFNKQGEIAYTHFGEADPTDMSNKLEMLTSTGMPELAGEVVAVKVDKYQPLDFKS
jgi:thiol-disulfide isomerase/thioredoxin